jgi:hypothetical protein
MRAFLFCEGQMLNRRFFNRQTRLMSEEPSVAAAPVTQQAAAPVQGKETFSREYVQELRQENASYRTRAAEAEKKAQEAVDAAKKAQEDAEAKAAKAAAEADARVTETHTKAEQRIIRAELKAEAIKAGMVDLDGLKLADLSSIALDEKGDVVGAEALMTSLKEAKPYLFGAKTTTSQTKEPPRKEEPKPFNANTASQEERDAKARELGLSPLKKR